MMLLLKHLDRSRFDPTLCLLERQGPWLDQMPADVPIIGLHKRSRRDAPLLVARLARILNATRPEVVFSKVDYTNEIVALAALAARSKAALIFGETALQSGALENMSYPPVRRALLRWAYPRATTVVVSTPGVADDLERLGIRGTFEVIPNMLALPTAGDAERQKGPHPFQGVEAPLLVAAGRLARGKGHADLLEALAILLRGRDCNLLVLGDGPERKGIETLARSLGIQDHVAFLGFVDEAHGLMAQADVFVSPSHSESFGNAIVEAMALAVPVVSTRVPAGPEWIIEDNETGVFAEPRNPEDLAHKIAYVLDNREVAERIASEGRLAARRFDIAGVVDAYSALFERAAGTSQQTSPDDTATRIPVT